MGGWVLALAGVPWASIYSPLGEERQDREASLLEDVEYVFASVYPINRVTASHCFVVWAKGSRYRNIFSHRRKGVKGNAGNIQEEEQSEGGPCRATGVSLLHHEAKNDHDRGSQVERSKFGSCILPTHPSSDKSPDEGWSGGLKSRDMETREEGGRRPEGWTPEGLLPEACSFWRLPPSSSFRRPPPLEDESMGFASAAQAAAADPGLSEANIPPGLLDL
ncbi:hypothetical protein PCANC_16400 [Puccinia coronata f. sp. avenae]|uniref:Uncharacterized protein n=1 Tax=Puccinia coronata f. sp. avenae TaxID=200324 RepID=A0A2N5SAX6_9BASI|nr:hypothetical protein PCASD_22802 [Puccinia coronata f. sp. avenae]PLW18282.1 hypothetical protein PCANC_16400 [Puccinia coronata f. sp. avenae]